MGTLQWGHRFSSVEMRWWRVWVWCGASASMGPPIFIGGNSDCSRVTIPRGCVLQWGHRFSSVEIPTARRPDAGLHIASMGPPIFIGGNVYLPSSVSSAVRLQWGHRFSSVEMSDMTDCTQDLIELQWGHRFSSVEIGISGCFASMYTGFNGATDFHRWKLRRASGCLPPAYMLQWGHRFSSVEISGGLVSVCVGSCSLQWGHRFSSVEIW